MIFVPLIVGTQGEHFDRSKRGPFHSRDQQRVAHLNKSEIIGQVYGWVVMKLVSSDSPWIVALQFWF